MPSTSLANQYLKKMMRSRDAVSSHSGLIPFETLCEKKGGTTLTIIAIIETTKRRTRKNVPLSDF